MRRPGRVSVQVDYTKVPDQALKDIRQHVGSESRQREQLDCDRRLWIDKLAAVEAEIKRRRI